MYAKVRLVASIGLKNGVWGILGSYINLQNCTRSCVRYSRFDKTIYNVYGHIPYFHTSLMPTSLINILEKKHYPNLNDLRQVQPLEHINSRDLREIWESIKTFTHILDFIVCNPVCCCPWKKIVCDINMGIFPWIRGYFMCGI